MEFLWVFTVIAGLSLISWVYKQIQEYFEHERSKQRDEIAVNVIAEYGISNEDKNSVNQLFNYSVKSIHRKIEETEEYEIITPTLASRRRGQVCPKCNVGHLVRRQGKHGSFLGCSRYPLCNSTKPVGWKDKKAKKVQKDQFTKKFMEDFKKAYN